jgi:hypothetical protein
VCVCGEAGRQLASRKAGTLSSPVSSGISVSTADQTWRGAAGRDAGADAGWRCRGRPHLLRAAARVARARRRVEAGDERRAQRTPHGLVALVAEDLGLVGGTRRDQARLRPSSGESTGEITSVIKRDDGRDHGRERAPGRGTRRGRRRRAPRRPGSTACAATPCRGGGAPARGTSPAAATTPPSPPPACSCAKHGERGRPEPLSSGGDEAARPGYAPRRRRLLASPGSSSPGAAHRQL